jgi:drug/metabolite transporter (DMT)-like permease
MGEPTTRMDGQGWLLLLLLSVLWGASFVFVGVAVKELPPFTIVCVRVLLAGAMLIPFLWISRLELPSTLGGWTPFFVMGLLNNVIPFSLFVTGQMQITGGMASVLNATTPLFTVLVMAAFGDERLVARRVAGVLVGILGVIVLRGQGADIGADQTVAILLCLCAALSYAFSGLWGRRTLRGVPPLTSATCQLMCSSLVMIVLAAVIDRPWSLPFPSLATCFSLVGSAALSTALGYIVFFNILVRSGATNVMLVTLLIPVTAILLGYLVLGETLVAREIVGALVIAGALLIIDGRLPGLRK